LIFQNANQPYSKWWSHLKYYERKSSAAAEQF
jgi:hypothetical protein